MQINRTAHHIKCCVINMGSGVERCCLRGSCCIHEFISCFYSRLGIRLQQPLHKVGWLGLCIHLLASIFILSPIFGIIFLLVYIRFIFPEVLSFLPCVKIPSVVFFPLCFGWNFRLMFLKEWPHISVQWLPVHLLHCLWKIAPFQCKTPLYSSNKVSAPHNPKCGLVLELISNSFLWSAWDSCGLLLSWDQGKVEVVSSSAVKESKQTRTVNQQPEWWHHVPGVNLINKFYRTETIWNVL